jgi:hypothetical protein
VQPSQDLVLTDLRLLTLDHCIGTALYLLSTAMSYNVSDSPLTRYLVDLIKVSLLMDDVTPCMRQATAVSWEKPACSAREGAHTGQRDQHRHYPMMVTSP